MATGSSVTRNINAVRRNLKRISKEMKQEIIREVEEVVLDLGIKASALAPVDTTRLRKSVEPEVIVKGNKIRGLVTFSAKNPLTGYDYALIQHEDLSFNHPRGGQAKYLEQPLKENSTKYKKRIDKKVSEVLRWV